MSEYQFYEFLALDRPLTESEQFQLRAISSRATISANRFQNEYEWGDLKADPVKLLVRYFDVHVYFTNWGARRLMLRLPKTCVNVAAIKRYFPTAGDSSARQIGSHLVLDFTVASDDFESDDHALEASIGSLAPLRAELLRGDLRPAYLVWLSAVESGAVAADAQEPEVPPELARLTAPQAALAAFLRLQPDLISAAAAASAEPTSDDDALRNWVMRLSSAQKDRWLMRSIDEPNLPLGAELRRQFCHHRSPARPTGSDVRRTVAALRASANALADSRSRREAASLKKVEAKAAKARQRYLTDLRAGTTAAWRTLEELVAQSSYDAAIRLATDLREISDRDDDSAAFAERLDALRSRQARRRGFFTRWNLLHARPGP